MEPFINKLRKDYPAITFVTADRASWLARDNRITYQPQDNDKNIWAVLHELGHALSGHTTYDSDISLLNKEIEAWQKANQLAKEYGIHIDENHIETCLDTYRDWLHKRSTCPTCEAHGLQHTQSSYSCFNCQTSWQVSQERFCRPYRLKKA